MCVCVGKLCVSKLCVGKLCVGKWCVSKWCVGNEHLNRCKTSTVFLMCRGTGADLPIQSNEAMAFRWMSGLVNHLYLHFDLGLVWLCMYGIQFPTDPMMDHFLSSV